MADSVSNAPVIDLTTALDPEALAAWIEFEYADHAARLAALLVRNARFLEVTDAGIRDERVAGHTGDFIADMREGMKALDETRARIKRPVLHAQRMIDGEARKLSEPVLVAAGVANERLSLYLAEKEAAERARLEAEQDVTLAVADAFDVTRMRAPGGSVVSMRESWTWDVVDLALVPLAYLSINESALKAAIRSGVRSVPGLRIYAERKAAVR